MNYFYFSASLPNLHLETPPPLSPAQFRQACARHLTVRDRQALDELDQDLDMPSSNTFVAAWKNAEIRLRNAIARLRAARRHRDPTPYLHAPTGPDPAVERAAAEALSKAGPLERELALDRIRWRTIDDLAGTDVFAPRALLAYALKLALASRWAAMNPTVGTERADRIITQEAT